MLGMEEDLPALLAEALHRKFPVEHADDDVVLFRGQRPVDDQDIPAEDARTFHRMAFHPHEEGGGGVLDQQLVEIELLLQVIIRRRGKAGAHPGGVDRDPRRRPPHQAVEGKLIHSLQFF